MTLLELFVFFYEDNEPQFFKHHSSNMVKTWSKRDFSLFFFPVNAEARPFYLLGIRAIFLLFNQ